jgi:hypothetical protein
MSKAMDALDRVAQYSAGWKHSLVIGEELALLRDYITTTEAERTRIAWDMLIEIEMALDKALHFKANDTHDDTIQAYEEWRDEIKSKLKLQFEADQAAQRQLGRDESAARIKELEEALKGLRRGDCFCEAGIDNPMMGGKHSEECLRAKSALSGARKGNSLGSVRGDEHLGAMLPDEAIFDARKVEP